MTIEELEKRVERLEALMAGMTGDMTTPRTSLSNDSGNWSSPFSRERELQYEQMRSQADREYARNEALRKNCSERERDEARWGRGPRAGSTGDPFIDDPFFNPWAPGGKFDKK